MRLTDRSSRPVTQGKEQAPWSSIIRLIWHFLATNKAKYLFWGAVLSLVNIFGLAPAYLIGKIVDFFTRYQPGDSLTQFYQLTILFGAIYSATAFIRLQAKREMAGVEIDAIYTAKVEGFERLMDFSLTWHNQENTGNKIQKIETGIENMRSILRQLGGNFFRITVQLIAIFAVFTVQGPLFLGFIVLYSAVVLLIERVYYQRLQVAQTDTMISNEQSSGTYFESTSNLLTIKTLGLKSGITAKVVEKEQAAKERRLRIRSLGIRKWQYFQVWNGICLVGFLLLIGNRFTTGAITLGLIFTLYNYYLKFTDSISDATEIFVDFIEYKVGLTRMLPIFTDVVTGDSGTKQFPTKWNAITVDNLGFSYQLEDESFTITNLSLQIPRGSKVGIAGKTGSGKSTLMKLLLGLYPISSGSILVGNTPLPEIRHQELTRSIATVLQETELFNLTMRENLSLYKQVSPEVLERAIQIAQLQPVIDALPNGLDSLVGEKGYKLSGGERQRLGIARALCANTEILILDEATSALDSKTEQAIQKGLATLTDKTIISIAHRLSTLAQTDHIYVFEAGKVLEDGTFTELLAQGGRFSEMHALQSNQE